MRARDLAESAPVVRLTDPVSLALELISAGAPGVVVVDAEGSLVTVLPASQVLALAVPSYLQADPVLARTWDEASADRFAATARSQTVESALPRRRAPSVVVQADDTALEIALAMSGGHSPLVVVVDGSRLVGSISAQRLVTALLGT